MRQATRPGHRRFDDLWLYMARSKITSDFIVDRLEEWWQEVRLRYLSTCFEADRRGQALPSLLPVATTETEAA